MKDYFFASCRECGGKTKKMCREKLGVGLVIMTVFYLLVFGIYGATIVWSLLFFFTGLYWIITRPSKKIICDECSKKIGND
jgi:hypothetical protein